MKTIYFYKDLNKPHSLYNELLNNPPNGYKFYIPELEKRELVSKGKIDFVKSLPLVRRIYRGFLYHFYNPIKNENLKFSSKVLPKDIDLIFSAGRLVLRQDKPYVLDMVDKINCLMGYNQKLFLKNRKYIQQSLESPSCKAIVCFTEALRADIKNEFKSPKINKKLTVVYITKNFPKKKLLNKKHNSINLLFVGSINNPQDVLIKGALETLESFKQIVQKNPNVHLFVRCKLPEFMKKKYGGLKNLHLIENFLSEKEMEDLYLNANIFITPAHNLNALAPLEAMYYGLPLIATDTWAVNEVVINNYNGFLIKKSEEIPYDEEKIHQDIKNPRYLRMFEKVDRALIERIVAKVEFLINNPNLMKRMGKNGRQMVLTGKFSYKNRIEKLKTIFDGALK